MLMGLGKYVLGLFALAMPVIAGAQGAYNPTSKTFNASAGGIDERYLNASPQKYSGLVDILNEADKKEKGKKFVPSQASNFLFTIDGIYNKEITKKTYCSITKSPYAECQFPGVKNMVDRVDVNTAHFDPLKELMVKLYIIDGLKISQSEKLEKMYGVISETIGKGTKKKEGSANVADLCNGFKGTDTDIASAYYSLLNTFGILSYVKRGTVQGEVPEERTWISVITERGEIDLDPAMYQGLVPLEIRNKEIKKISFEVVKR